jgi:hypothetical protein
MSYALLAHDAAISDGERSESQRLVRKLRMASWNDGSNKQSNTDLMFLRDPERLKAELPIPSAKQ